MTTLLAAPAAPDRARWAWTWSPRGTLALLLFWAGVHVLLRLLLPSALTADDAREAVLAQSLQWGYQARQPPLYNWLAWGALFRFISILHWSLTESRPWMMRRPPGPLDGRKYNGNPNADARID